MKQYKYANNTQKRILHTYIYIYIPKKLDHGWPEKNITSQARSAQRCRMRSFSLHEAFVKQGETAPGKVLCANWSVQVGLRKLLYASCTVQVALRKLLRASCSGKLVPARGCLQVALCKLLCASCSVQVALRKLLCASCSRQGALRKTGRCKLVCASCSVQLALRKLLCASCFKNASCILRRPPADQGGIEPATGRFREQAREPRDNSRGLVRTTKVVKNLEFLHLDHADSRTGLREHRRNRKKTRVFAPRPRRSPQRVARAPQKSQKTTMGFCTSTTPIPAEGRIFV